MKKNIMQGTLYLTTSQTAFVASGYLINVGLGRLLGPDDYGLYTVVISLMTMVNLILTTGIPQAVSKYVAHGTGSSTMIRDTALKMQLVLSIAIFLIYFLLAEKIALLLNDSTLTPFIRASAFIVPGYAIYSMLIGYLNGLLEYGKQAIITIYYSLIKVVFILALVIAGYSVMGAIVGFVFAPIAALLFGAYFMWNGGITLATSNDSSIKSSISVKKILDFSIPIMFFSVVTNLIIGIDLFFVKAYLTNYETGIYSAASMISKVPFFLIGGLFGALFPAISNASANNNIERTRKYILNSIRHSLVAIVPAVIIISAFSETLITLVYSSKYASGAGVLSVLIFGIGFYSLFFLFMTILNGSGRPYISLFISAIVLALNILLNIMLVPVYHLIGAAAATGLASIAGFVMAGIYINWKFGIFSSNASS
ncbi:MAG TPA: flippase [Candidatus Methylomirabilis sp.]|nr:flippase [Candidatus Methylomirabilis sp.]